MELYSYSRLQAKQLGNVFHSTVEAVCCPAKKGGKWYRGVVEAAKCLMTRWHMDEAEKDGFATQQRTPRVMTEERGVGKEGRPN